MSRAIKAAIYARVSTGEQADNYSLLTQFEGCRKYAQNAGFNVVAEFSDTFTGTTLERPEFDRLKAQASDFDAVIVYVQDRFSRSDPLDTWNEIRQFNSQGVTVHAVDTGLIDANDLIEALPMLIRADAAQKEARKIQKRSREGRQARARDGKVSMPIVQYGYAYGDGKLTIHSDESRIVVQVFMWYVYGDGENTRLGFHAIADKLTSMGIPTRRDKISRSLKRKRGYGVWAASAIADIIHAEMYTGVWYGNRMDGKGRPKPREEWIAVPVPALIDRAMWEAAQLVAARAKRGASQSTKAHSLMHGRITCATCGRVFAPERGRRHSFIYKCPGERSIHSHDGRSKTCYGGFSMPEIDSLIWNEIVRFLKHPDTIIEGLRARDAEREVLLAPDRAYLERCTAELDKANARRERVLTLYIDGTHDKPWLDSQCAQLDRQRADLTDKTATLTKRLAKAEIDAAQTVHIEQFCERIRQGIDDFTLADKRMVVNTLEIEAVIQRGDAIRVGRKPRATGSLILHGCFPSTSITIGAEKSPLLAGENHSSYLLCIPGSSRTAKLKLNLSRDSISSP